MLKRVLVVGLAVFCLGLAAGCSEDGDPSPFEGDWVSATAGRLSFEGDDWSDGDGDSGRFDFSGDYPDFEVRFHSDAGTFEKTATFADKRTMELCDVGAGGASVNCSTFVYDPHTVSPP